MHYGCDRQVDWKPRRFQRKVDDVYGKSYEPKRSEACRFALNHALIDVTAYRRPSVQASPVVGGCICGCSSQYFEPEGQRGDVQMLADELTVYPDGQQAGVILWDATARSSGWKCTIASRSRPTGDAGIWNAATDPIDQSLARLLQISRCFVIALATSPYIIGDISHARMARNTWVRVSLPFVYCALIHWSEPVSLTATSEIKMCRGLPSAKPLCSVENRIGPAFL